MRSLGDAATGVAAVAAPVVEAASNGQLGQPLPGPGVHVQLDEAAPGVVVLPGEAVLPLPGVAAGAAGDLGLAGEDALGAAARADVLARDVALGEAPVGTAEGRTEPPRRKRTGMCIHRRALHEFCPRCD